MPSFTLRFAFLFCALLAWQGAIDAQNFQNGSISFDGQNRSYLVYTPIGYGPTSPPIPLLFNFHGGNGDIASQVAISDLRSIADTAGFIAVYPQALPDPNDGGSTNWLHKDPTQVDDVLFIDALIDSLSDQFRIDTSRIYACGYSLGGEFTYELGCRLNERMAAIAVVARTMQTYQYNNCMPNHPTGVLTILGTADAVSDYNGMSFGGIQYYVSADDVHQYWALHNNSPNQQITAVPNTDPSDGSTVELQTWTDASNCQYVKHFKVNGGGHDWPGSFGNMDIRSDEEIWRFVSQFDLNGSMGCNSTSAGERQMEGIKVYPNPFREFIIIDAPEGTTQNYRLLDAQGQLVKIGTTEPGSSEIELNELPLGLYFLQTGSTFHKLLKTN